MKKRMFVRITAAVATAALVSSVAGIAQAIVAPANDRYQRAISLSNTGGSRAGTTTGATAQGQERTSTEAREWIGSGDTHTVWYRFGGRAGVLTVDTCTSPGFNTMIEVFERPPFSDVRYAASDLVYSSASGCASASGAYVSFPVRAQTNYYIRVRGETANQSGAFTLTWTFQRGSGRR